MLEAVNRRGCAMAGDFGRLYADLDRRTGAYGVRVISRRLPPETPALFHGPPLACVPARFVELLPEFAGGEDEVELLEWPGE